MPAVTVIPTPTADRAAAVRGCLDPGSADVSDTTARAVAACLRPNFAFVRVHAVSGERPLLLLNVGASIADPATFSAWRDGSFWKVLEYQLGDYALLETDQPADPGRSAITPPYEREAASSYGDGTDLIALFGFEDYSSAPGMAAVVFHFETMNPQWNMLWTSTNSDIGRLGHSHIEFIGDGIDLLHADGDSSRLPNEESLALGPQANAGPHQYFDETWAFHRDEYLLREQHVLASAYNTMVNFMYHLGLGDGLADADVANLTLIPQAQGLGLVQDPLHVTWSGDAPDKGCEGIGHLRSALANVVMSFAANQDRCVIESIELDRSPH
jgi:hypothetical protein